MKKVIRAVSVGLAVCVPAAAIAFSIPNSFSAGTTISSQKVNENFALIATELTSLRSEVNTLKSDLAAAESELSTTKSSLSAAQAAIASLRQGGAPVVVTALALSNSTVSQRTITAASDGALLLSFSGPSKGDIQLFVYSDAASNSSIAYSTDGVALSVPVSKGQQYTIAATFSLSAAAGDQGVKFVFTPAEVGGAAPN